MSKTLKKEKAKRIGKILDQLFPDPPICLDHKDPYTLLIAVLLSAQCTDKRVNQITPELFAIADTPVKMGKLKPKEIEKIIRPCGLAQSKSRAIHQLSHDLIAKYKGKVPANLEDLQSLPGVGPKTAAVVLVQAFHKPAFPVDTHIFRCAHRWGLSSGKTPSKVSEDLQALFPKKDWGKRHLQIIYFARTFCPARGHQKAICPICNCLK